MNAYSPAVASAIADDLASGRIAITDLDGAALKHTAARHNVDVNTFDFDNRNKVIAMLRALS